MPSTEGAPVFDMSAYLAQRGGDPSRDVLSVCRGMAEFLHKTGFLVIRDPRVSSADNEAFLGLMQRYYSQPLEALLAEESAGIAPRPALWYIRSGGIYG